MKGIKRICTFIFLILFMFSTPLCLVNAEEVGFNFKSFKEDGKRKWEVINSNVNPAMISPAGYFSSSDERIVYCIEPGIVYLNLKDGKYTTVKNSIQFPSLTGLDTDVLDELHLIGYFGYGYNGDKSDEMYVATQLLIWNTVVPNSSAVYSGEKSVINQKMKEIQNRVDNANRKPSFNSKTLEINLNEEVEIIDSNGMLNQGYTVSACINCNATIQDNSLIVSSNNIGTARVILSRKISDNSKGSILYVAGTHQKLMSFGDPASVESTVNFKVNGSEIRIQKSDKETGKIEAQGDATLKGAIYGIYDSDNNLVTELATDENGQASYYVGYGTYTVKELVAPIGYKLSDEVFTITIDEINADEGVTILAHDEVIKGKGIIYKESISVNGTIKAENGAEFNIINSKGEIVKKLVTDEDGVSLLKLPYGSYTLHQTKGLKNHSLSEDIPFTITSEDKVFKFRLKDIEYSNFSLTKTDISGANPIEGATIEIYKKEKSGDILIYKGVTNKDGKINISHLELGEYYFIETKAPEHYILNTDKHYFNVSEYGKIYYKTLSNERYSSFEITKVDITGSNPVEGATVEIYKINNDGSDILVYTGVTDQEGKIYMQDIAIGDYYFIETDAPFGYLINKEKHLFSITENGITYKESFEDDYTVVEFEKRDFEDGNLLEGAKICIYNLEGEEIACGVTDQKGKIIFEKLPLGHYYYQEIEAPKGYELNSEKYEFELSDENSKLSITLTNDLIVEVPDTHKNSFSFVIVTLGLFIVGIGLIMYGKKK